MSEYRGFMRVGVSSLIGVTSDADGGPGRPDEEPATPVYAGRDAERGSRGEEAIDA